MFLIIVTLAFADMLTGAARLLDTQVESSGNLLFERQSKLKNATNGFSNARKTVGRRNKSYFTLRSNFNLIT